MFEVTPELARETVVEGVRVPRRDGLDLRGDDFLSLALEQRVFGPRRLLVAFATAKGRVIGVAHTERTDPPEVALAFVVDFGLSRFKPRAALAVAYCDEPVALGPPPPDLATRFMTARAICASRGVVLGEWVSCDDTIVRFASITLNPERAMW